MNASELHKLLKPYRESSHGTNAEVEGTLLHGKVKARDTSGLTEEQSGLVQKCWDFMAELEASGLKVAEQEKNVYIEELGIGGEIDAFMTGDNSCAVIDWKFGKAKTVPPAMNPQLMAYAYCALTETGCDNCTAYIFNPRRGDCVSYTFYNPQELLENIRQMNTGKWEKGKTKKQSPVFPLGCMFNPYVLTEDNARPSWPAFEGITSLSYKHPTAEFVDQKTGAKIMLKLINGKGINKIDYTDIKIMTIIESFRQGIETIELAGLLELEETWELGDFKVTIETIAKMLHGSIDDTRERVSRLYGFDSLQPCIEAEIQVDGVTVWGVIIHLLQCWEYSNGDFNGNRNLSGIGLNKNSITIACSITKVLYRIACAKERTPKALKRFLKLIY